MKKTTTIVIAICMILFVASCAPDLPDPTSAVKDFYEDSVKSIESEIAEQMLNESAFRDLVEGFPELEEPLKNLIAAYLEDIKYTIVEDETIIDQKAKTAQVLVEVSCVDLVKLNERLLGLIIEKSNEIMTTGRAATQEELNDYYLVTAAQLIIDGDAERVSGYQEVELSYNEAAEQWEVTNRQAIISELM